MCLLSCKNLKKQKGDFVLSGITFSVKPGYVVGVIGRNGAGKTTLLRLLLGSYVPEEGEILLNGVSPAGEVREYKRQLAYVLNETPFPQELTPRECQMLYGSWYNGFDEGTYSALLREYGVPEKLAVKKMSKGQQIRHQLAFALSYEASLYILDEPGANLDVEFREEFFRCVRDITKDGDKSVIYVTHLVDELEQLADEILWISTCALDAGTASKEERKKSVRNSGQKFFGTMDELKEGYQLISLSREEMEQYPEIEIVGGRQRQAHQEVLARAARESLPEKLLPYSRYATLKEIMYYTEKGVYGNEADF